MKAIYIALLAILCCTAQASETIIGDHNQSAAGACQSVKPGDARLRLNALWVQNISQESAQVACSPLIDTSSNGTTKFGGVINNTQNSNRTVTCVAAINTGGSGPIYITRSVIVGYKEHAVITWSASDLGANRTLVGGQAGFTCTMPPGTTLQYIWSQSVHGS